MKCWKCNFETEDPPLGKLSFRSVCEQCSVWLHCCKNCKNYRPGLPNDCKIPGTELISDREAANFCEEFKLSGVGRTLFSDPKNAAKKLFKEEGEDSSARRDFDSLF